MKFSLDSQDLAKSSFSVHDGGRATFAGKEPVRKMVMKAGAASAIILAANAVAETAIWKKRTGGGRVAHAWNAATSRSTRESPRGTRGGDSCNGSLCHPAPSKSGAALYRRKV
jgi:hypothetical protein